MKRFLLIGGGVVGLLLLVLLGAPALERNVAPASVGTFVDQLVACDRERKAGVHHRTNDRFVESAAALAAADRACGQAHLAAIAVSRNDTVWQAFREVCDDAATSGARLVDAHQVLLGGRRDREYFQAMRTAVRLTDPAEAATARCLAAVGGGRTPACFGPLCDMRGLPDASSQTTPKR